MTKNKTIALLLTLLILQNITLGQDRFRFGLSGGLTFSSAKTIQKNSYGAISPGFGLNFYFPLSIKLYDKLSVETGLGYYFNKFNLKYSGNRISNGHAHPYTPLKICYTKSLKDDKALFINIGFVLDYFPVKNTFTSTDSVNQVIIIDNSIGKSNQFLSFEFGLKKTTSKNKIHQISLQYFYGLQEIANGAAYHFNNSSDSFKYTYSGHFASIQYTFWFGYKA